LKILPIFLLLFFPTSFAWSQTPLSFQLGYAQNQSIPSYRDIPGSTAPPKISQHALHLGIHLKAALTPNWKIGVGAALLTDRYPFDHSMGYWKLDLIRLDYRLYRSWHLRYNFGVGKQYQNKVAYGWQNSSSVFYQMNAHSGWGLSWLTGHTDQEQGDGTPELRSGIAEFFSLFYEYHF